MTNIRPEDILPDGDDFTIINGVKARKGSIAAVLANIDSLESSNASEDDKKSAREAIQQLAPVLEAIGINKHVTWKNTEVQKILTSFE